MAEFEELQTVLAAARASVDARKRDLFAERERIDRLKRNRATLDRLRPGDPSQPPPPDLADLDAEIEEREAGLPLLRLRPDQTGHVPKGRPAISESAEVRGQLAAIVRREEHAAQPLL